MKKRTLSVLACLSLFLLVVACPPANVSAAESGKHQKVTFNFVDVELTTITKFISELTGKNFIFDERVKGKITIIAPSKLEVDDAYNLFTSVLELKGFTVIPSGVDAYKIVPVTEAKQKGFKITTGEQPVNESYVARLIPLTYISSDDALNLIKPVMSTNGHASAFGPGNLLLVIDSGLNVEKVLGIIASIDKQSVTEAPDIIFLKNSSADAVAKTLNEGIGRRAKSAAGSGKSADEVKAVADQRLNAVILFGDKWLRDSMKSLIAMLDVRSPDAQGRINVFFLENADATELTKALEGIIKGARSQGQSPVVGAAPVTTFESAGGITITADKSTNSIIVVASPADYQNISQVIKQLDRRRKQVFVEAMIAEVSIDKLLELGVKWRAAVKKNGEPVVIGGFGKVDQSTIQSVITGLTGVSVGGLGNYLTVPQDFIPGATNSMKIPGFAALFSLNDFKGVVNVLSSPQLLTSDNKEAEIVVGENVPFISKRERDLTTTGTVLSSIDRKDVGITLRITPQITEGDYVKLDIYQEISSVKKDSENIIINVGPTTTKRSTKTSVIVKDNQTVIISGLMQETDEENITKFPVLGDIPLLGWLFKEKSVSKKKTNLLVFLTPRVVKDSQGLGHITGSKERDFARIEKIYTDGELLIKFRDSVTGAKAEEIITGGRASVLRVMGGNLYHVRLMSGQAIADAAKAFSSLPEVEYAEPNFTLKTRQ